MMTMMRNIILREKVPGTLLVAVAVALTVSNSRDFVLSLLY